ncbi:MAG: biotin-dependent carboxyltransferase family protein [Planctomycetota bacterium]
MSRPVLRVIRGGLMTTVQDCGRMGYGHLGVPLSGALDLLSHRLANRLAGNPDTAATLELTLRGDEFEFLDDVVVAVCGADMQPQMRGKAGPAIPFPVQRPVSVPRGTVLSFGGAVRGCRAVLAVAGGIDVPVLLGSRSTLLRSGWGGFEGRRLAAGDCLAAGEHSAGSGHGWLPTVGRQTPWSIRLQSLPLRGVATLRFLPGKHWNHLTPDSKDALSGQRFLLRSESDRMGYRLRCQALRLQGIEPGQLRSAAVVPGTLQLPPDGQLILLMADCAPTGGYPCVGHVITADLSLAAQLRPGDALQLTPVSYEEALLALRQQERDLRRAVAMASL